MQFDLFQTLERLGIPLASGRPIICVITGGDLDGLVHGRNPPRRQWTVPEDSADLARRFFADLLGGGLGFAAALPARSIDIFECYRAWCHRSGLEPLNQPRFVRVLTQGGRAKMKVRRYVDGERVAQHAIAFEGGRPVPEQGGKGGAASLGACIEAFRVATNVYRAGGA